MGAAVAVEAAGIPADILQLFKECEETQRKIAEADSKFLKSQQRQMWKNHKKIVAVVCSKTKNQLSRMAAAAGSGPGLATQLCDMLGGAYGEFVRNLVLSRADINTEAMRAALDCIGCDEMSIIHFLCVCSPDEVAALLEKYNDAAAVDLPTKIDGKMEKGSALQIFFRCLLSNRRDADGTTDVDIVPTHAADVKDICEDASAARNKELFDLMCCISRSQCALLNTELLQTHGVTLDDLFKKKFESPLSTALSLWTANRDDAICQVLHSVLHDPKEAYDSLSGIISKYDKLHLKAIRSKYEALFRESLVSGIEHAAVGNHKLALVAWISSGAFDGMHEEEVLGIIAAHGMLSAAMADADTQSAIREGLTKEKAALLAYNDSDIDADIGAIPEPVHMKLPPISSSSVPKEFSVEKSISPEDKAGISSTERKEKAEEKAHSTPSVRDQDEKEEKQHTPPAVLTVETNTPASVEALESPTKIAPLSVQSKKAVSVRGLNVDFDAKYKAVSNFLKEEFSAFDSDKSGYLESAEFWNALRSFKLGYTDEEIGAMAEWTDWDCDGHISLSEVINELAESVITMIEGRGEELLTGLQVIKARLKLENEELKRLESDGGLSVDLVGYLKDSFEAYDTDENGSLGTEEFWKVINVVLCETVNGLKEIELEEMKVLFVIQYGY